MNKARLKRSGARLAAVSASLALALLLAAGCGGSRPESSNGETIRQLVADLSSGKADAAAASISATELVVTGVDGKRTVYKLPDDAFFVSIAPYIETTHPCEIHSLTGCRGELPNAEFDLLIEDESGGKVLETTAVSQDNGFIDLWLPRNQTFRVTVSRDGRTAVSRISTFDNDPTCITTMKLL
jgi:hypothetical protein